MSRPLDKAGWQALADTLTARLETRAYIDDRFVDAASGETFETINPATGEVLARVASCDQADAELAVAHARRAFDGGEWSRLAPTRRKRVLLRLAEDRHDALHDIAQDALGLRHRLGEEVVGEEEAPS